MKIQRKEKEPETIRKGRGVLVVGQQDSKQESKEEPQTSQPLIQVPYVHLYFRVGKVYSFTVGACVCDQKTDGTQQTKYYVIDKQGKKHLKLYVFVVQWLQDMLLEIAGKHEIANPWANPQGCRERHVKRPVQRAQVSSSRF